MPKKQELFCQLTYVRRNSTGVTRSLHFRIYDVTISGILNWKIPGWKFVGYCPFGVIQEGPADKLTNFKLQLRTLPQVGCDVVKGAVYTRELRISEGCSLNLDEEKENYILTQEGPHAMYSQSLRHWGRDIFRFLGIEE